MRIGRMVALTVLVALAACNRSDVAETGEAAEVEGTESEIADLEAAIADTAVADVVADDPGGRLAADGPVAADPLASAYPEAAPPVETSAPPVAPE